MSTYKKGTPVFSGIFMDSSDGAPVALASDIQMSATDTTRLDKKLENMGSGSSGSFKFISAPVVIGLQTVDSPDKKEVLIPIENGATGIIMIRATGTFNSNYINQVQLVDLSTASGAYYKQFWNFGKNYDQLETSIIGTNGTYYAAAMSTSGLSLPSGYRVKFEIL